jgi:predicted aldo/keto reductase-like oxidoreductase
MGTGPLKESNLVRYAYDKGINYFDTAESYENGNAERAIGEALQFIEREKIFIATKAGIRPQEDKDAVIQKVRQSLGRLKTDYVDAYSIHYLSSVEGVDHPGYHAAMDELKAEGRVKFTGASYHGPEELDQTGTADVLGAAAEDGRFDLLLFVFNFLNHSEGDRILAACKANNVAATAMKTAPGRLRPEPFDPENLSAPAQEYYDNMVRRGRTPEAAMDVIRRSVEARNAVTERTRPFVEQHGIQTEEALQFASIQWVLQNPDMHTACISIDNFDLIDKLVALSGTTLSTPADDMLQNVRVAMGSQYCRHGCVECMPSCPQRVPVSTIMRYAHYFEGQGRERYAMSRYAGLEGPGAGSCSACAGECAGACPYGIHVQPSMLRAHELLTLA